ncbi:arsenate reductase/protein-tyrosine-phosphatase family protein [Arthrobacter sp. 179]|uniref:arsenate reductase/protein-tyrosine-phosphatase family protein n=1 Tax=Arthrobacter sp. 179 TaxID=3457734 RepID=UPI004034A728
MEHPDKSRLDDLVGRAADVSHFNLLFVCTGNICRSPTAALMIAKWLEEEFPGQFTVESAGVRAFAGEAIDPGAAAQLPEDIDASDFHARQLTVGMLEKADLVLCMDRGQRASCAQMQPQVLRRIFTLREFARIASYLAQRRLALSFLEPVRLEELAGAARWRQLLQEAPSGRPQSLAALPSDDDVIDPYGASIREYRSAAQQILAAIEDLRSYNNP